jgi:hypothetical protein
LASLRLGSIVADHDRRRPAGLPVWALGWQRAALLRDALAVADVEPARLCDALTRHDPALDDRASGRVRVAWVAGGGPARGVPPATTEPARRFTAACALYPALFLGQPARPSAIVLQRDVQAGVHSEARAFATELVAPLERVRSLVGGAIEDGAALARAARALRAPLGCVYHQVRNRLVAELA